MCLRDTGGSATRFARPAAPILRGVVALDRPAIRAAARKTLGHRVLLPGQAEAVQAITAGRDTLALLPTGGGKSAVYQLAGMTIDGPTVVVSPLIALQQDQSVPASSRASSRTGLP